jgi:murein tripeptide amidase MpaA
VTGYMTSTVISAHLDALVAAHPTVCTRSQAADWRPGTQGGASGYVKVGVAPAGPPAQRNAVLLIGGVHARELAQPDALVSFLEKLLPAYASHSAITYPAWTDPLSTTVYGSFIIPAPWVRAIVERLDLYVAPLVNDDGRDFVLTPLPTTAPRPVQELHKMWRKNRRAAPAGNTNPQAAGVDINRNFDILWNYRHAYNMALPNVGVHSSTDPASELFIGSGAESEPEALNVASLMRTKNISYFIDFHAFGRDVMYSWGIETNQIADPTQTFSNAAWDGRRDGTHNAVYKEYIPAAAQTEGRTMADRVSDQIRIKAGGADPVAEVRSTYTTKQSASMYVTSGASDDYCFSRWFTGANAGTPVSQVLGLTVEVGGDPRFGVGQDEGGFAPDYVNNFPKLEREIHVACWAFLSAVAARSVRAPSAPPPPAGGP